MKEIYSLQRNWTSSDYYSLVDLAKSVCRFFLLVVRGRLLPKGESLLQELNPFLIERRQSKKWPGTELGGSEVVEVRKYRLVAESAETLKKATSNLWDWSTPNYPEDLSFLLQDGTPWFITTGHEKDAYFKLSSMEKKIVEAVLGPHALRYDCADPMPDERY